MPDSQELEMRESILDTVLYTDYRATSLRLGTVFVALFVLLLGLAPGMFTLGSETVATACAAAGLVFSGLVIWAGYGLVTQSRGIDASAQKVAEFTDLKGTGMTRGRILAEFDDIAAVYLSPRVNLWSHHHEWIYPIMLLTKDGRSITLSNQEMVINREDYAIPTATRYAEIIGCDLYLPDERTPVKVVRQGHEFTLEPKAQDVGLLGRFVALGAVTALVWGLWKLATLV